MRACFTSVLLAFAATSAAYGSPGELLQTYTNPNPNASNSDEFGASIAALGNNGVIVAAPFTKHGAFTGAVYLFDASSGTPTRTFLNPMPNGADEFGMSVAGVGTNWVVVGAPYSTEDTGAAYVFNATTGVLARTLIPTYPSPGNLFGRQLATFDSTHVLVSATGESALSYGGAVHMYDVTTGADVKDFANPDHTFNNDSFGSAIATIDSNRILVGAGLTNDGAVGAGAAYVMNVSTGAPLLTLQNPIPNADAHFGWSAASIGDNLIAVGAPDDNIKAGDSGAVYIFDATTGALLHTLYAPTPQYEGRFGSSLTATGNGVLLVGSELDNTAVSGGGAVYAFDATTGQLLTTLVGSKRN